MGSYQISKGKDLKIKGAAVKETVDKSMPPTVAIQPQDFKGIKPRLFVKVGDAVKVGTVVLRDKTVEDIAVCSPVSGKVIAINRGAKRVLLQIVIESDGSQEKEKLAQSYSS